LQRGFGGTDVQALIEEAGVGGDDFTVKLARQVQRQGRLTDGRGTDEDKQVGRGAILVLNGHVNVSSIKDNMEMGIGNNQYSIANGQWKLVVDCWK
jgi:hypothetical protein